MNEDTRVDDVLGTKPKPSPKLTQTSSSTSVRSREEADSTPKPMDAIDLEYRRLFDSLDVDADGAITSHELFDKLGECGIRSDDPRTRDFVASLSRVESIAKAKIDYEKFKSIAKNTSSLIKNAIQGNMVIPDFQELCKELEVIFEVVKKNKTGKVADYIPQLSRVNPEQFALSICTIDGQRFSLGESQTKFCVQSVSKPINYCIALEEHGETLVHKHVGRESSGRGFNELSLNREGLPHNPMINSGAIMSCSLVRPKLDSADRFDQVLDTWAKLSGRGDVGFNNPVYLSERQTADRNFALGYFMRENKAFPEGTDLIQTLEFYFQCCSIETTSDSLAVVASSIANGGLCPLTGERVFNPTTIQHCLSLMSSCGMYDFSGEFAFSIGLPAKSGVSGTLMLVIPQVMGVAIWSPRLDALGNSVRGVEFCKHLVSKYNFHNYDSLTSKQSTKRDPRLKRNQSKIENVVNLCWAASQGDLVEVQKLSACGVDLDAADYDGRTAIHLAASEGHENIIEYLISKGATLNPIDRWGGTPLADAYRGKHDRVIKLLEKRGAKK